MAEFQILDLSQTAPYELPEGGYVIHYVGADGDEYLDRRNKVQIDVTAQVVIIWSSDERLKGKRLRTYPRERVILIDKVIA